MARKSGRPTRRELRDERKREKEAAVEAERAAAGRRRRWLLLIALVSGGGALAVHRLELPRFLIGLSLLAGVGAFLAVALGGVGGSVRARARGKAGNIDFGN